MGKLADRILKKQAIKNLNSQNKEALVEGHFQIAFTFDGRTHTRTHFYSAEELKGIKELITEVGEGAADTILSRGMVHHAGLMGENILAVAFQLYALKHFKPAEGAQNILMPTAVETKTGAELYREFLDHEEAMGRAAAAQQNQDDQLPKSE